MVVKYYLCKFLYSHFLLFVENCVPTDMTAWGSLLPGKPHLGGEKGSGDFLVSFSVLMCVQASDAVTLPGGVSTAPNQALRSLLGAAKLRPAWSRGCPVWAKKAELHTLLSFYLSCLLFHPSHRGVRYSITCSGDGWQKITLSECTISL